MSKLTLGEWEQRPYGERADGVVADGDHHVRIRIRRPSIPALGGALYVMANGWTAGQNSMRVPAIEAAKSGHTGVTFRYTNTGSREALRQNVRDLTTVIEAFPSEEQKRAVGLSMGGAVVTMALERVGTEIKRATLVAPGMYLDAHYYSPFVIARRMLAESAEIGNLHTNVRTRMHLLADGLVNCVQRPHAVTAEIRELLSGNVHEELRRIKSQPDAPYIRFMYGEKDRLIPMAAQIASIEGLPFDDVSSYKGGHVRLAYDPTLSQDIFQMDGQTQQYRSIA